jgi:arylsulfatase A-like enzyme
MTSGKRFLSPKAIVVTVLVLAAAVVAGFVFGLRSHNPSYLRGESGRVSPVLKPSGLEVRDFFLVGGRYLIRLDYRKPSLLWKIARPATGELKVVFHALLKGETATALTFSASLAEGKGDAKELLSQEWRPRPGEAVEREFKVPVSFRRGAAIEFRLDPPSAGDPAIMDAGITVPSITTKGEGPRPSNLLIISIDALRRDFLGIYRTLSGHPPELSYSPEIDRFSEDAVVFLNARTTQPSTWPALSSFYLSAYTADHGTTENREFLRSPGSSLATLMRDRGFATLALGSNAINLNIPGFEEKRQFNRTDEPLLARGRSRIAGHAGAPFLHWYHLFGCHNEYLPPEWVMKIVARDDPGYVYKRINTNEMMSSQGPYSPREVADVRRLYGGALFYTDFLLKETFDDLKRLGLWDDTLIIITADHGEELLDHNGFFHHSPSLYEGALCVPLLIKFPHQRDRRVVAENVSHIDLLPTIHHYFAGRPEPGRYAGRSLLDLLAGKERAFRERVLFSEVENSRVVAAVFGSFKLIYNPGGVIPHTPLGLPFPMGPVEFYDLSKDPGETTNLAASGHPVLRRLQAEASRYIQKALAPRPERAESGEVELSEQERREADEVLRSLGYIK